MSSRKQPCETQNLKKVDESLRQMLLYWLEHIDKLYCLPEDLKLRVKKEFKETLTTGVISTDLIRDLSNPKMHKKCE